jgi:uncharacterized protein YbjT (DUF2867 family)
MTGKLIIYGATGYTGQLVSEQAKQAGLDFIVAAQGRKRGHSPFPDVSDRIASILSMGAG